MQSEISQPKLFLLNYHRNKILHPMEQRKSTCSKILPTQKPIQLKNFYQRVIKVQILADSLDSLIFR